MAGLPTMIQDLALMLIVAGIVIIVYAVKKKLPQQGLPAQGKHE